MGYIMNDGGARREQSRAAGPKVCPGAPPSSSADNFEKGGPADAAEVPGRHGNEYPASSRGSMEHNIVPGSLAWSGHCNISAHYGGSGCSGLVMPM